MTTWDHLGWDELLEDLIVLAVVHGILSGRAAGANVSPEAVAEWALRIANAVMDRREEMP